MHRTDIDQTLRMWVKTLNPSWSDPSPYHNLRALKVPTLRASLGITGPPLTGFPPPCHLGNCGMDNQGWHNAKCTFVCYILGGHVHYMNAPCKRSTRHWGSSSLVEAWWILVDCTESVCNELHNIPPNILDLEERCNLEMCMLASQRHAQRRIHSNNLRGPWPDTLGNGNVSPVIWFVVHEHCILGWCNDLDKTAHDNDSELEQNNLRGGKHGVGVQSA